MEYYKEILGAITMIMVFYGYFFYISDIFKGKTKPHLLSWIVFVILDVISILVQYNAGAGPGVWGTIATTIVAATVMVLAFKYGEKTITKSDTISFILALITVGLYILVDDPTYSMTFVLIILTLAFYPTMRKSYHKPNEETMIMYVLAGVRSAIGIAATVQISFLTISLPVLVVILNIGFIAMVIVRKKQLGIN